MDIFDYAMQMEKDGEQYYCELAEASSDPGLTTILKMLAFEEARHFNVLRDMKAGSKAQIETSTLRADVKNIFQELQDADTPLDFTGPQIGAYRKAQDLERKSREFYESKADEAGSPEAKACLLKIAREEALHYQMLDTLALFISRSEPGQWLENAEWFHAEDY